MDNILKQMVDRHEVVTVYDKKNRMKEVIQEIVLSDFHTKSSSV